MARHWHQHIARRDLARQRPRQRPVGERRRRVGPHRRHSIRRQRLSHGDLRPRRHLGRHRRGFPAAERGLPARRQGRQHACPDACPGALQIRGRPVRHQARPPTSVKCIPYSPEPSAAAKTPSPPSRPRSTYIAWWMPSSRRRIPGARGEVAITVRLRSARTIYAMGDTRRRSAGCLRPCDSHLSGGGPGPVILAIPNATATYDETADPYRPVKGWKSAPDPADARAAVDQLLGARNPLIYAGEGVIYAGASEDLKAAAELVNVPVITTLQGQRGVPGEPSAVRRRARRSGGTLPEQKLFRIAAPGPKRHAIALDAVSSRFVQTVCGSRNSPTRMADRGAPAGSAYWEASSPRARSCSTSRPARQQLRKPSSRDDLRIGLMWRRAYRNWKIRSPPAKCAAAHVAVGAGRAMSDDGLDRLGEPSAGHSSVYPGGFLAPAGALRHHDTNHRLGPTVARALKTGQSYMG